MNRPTLWFMCGLSGSGKSTIAKQLAQEHENTVRFGQRRINWRL